MRLAVCECARGEFWGNNLINLNIPLEKKEISNAKILLLIMK